jgi:hypothetical protein
MMIALKLGKKQGQEKGKPKKTRRAIAAAGAAFLALGFVGLAVFGYLIFKGGGFSSLTGMADGIGLIVSLVVLIAGLFMK